MKWFACWIGSLFVTEVLQTNVYVLNNDTRMTKRWHLVFYVSLVNLFIKGK
jgi:hypothetical protein